MKTAFAASYIDCKISGGDKQGRAIAPKTFEINEAGEVDLYIGDHFGASISVDDDANDIYYASHDIVFQVGAQKKLFGRGNKAVRGREVYSARGCTDEGTTTGTYAFTTLLPNGERKTEGTAKYDCTCALD